jgi:hypothetical protein
MGSGSSISALALTGVALALWTYGSHSGICGSGYRSDSVVSGVSALAHVALALAYSSGSGLLF